MNHVGRSHPSTNKTFTREEEYRTDFEETRNKVLSAYTIGDLDTRDTFLFLEGRLELNDKLIFNQHKNI